MPSVTQAFKQFIFTGNLYICYLDLVGGPKSSQIGIASTLAAEVRSVCGKLTRRLREHGGRSDLTPSQVTVILHLEKAGSATVSSLARVEGMRPQSMSSVMTPLQESGLVRGVPDPNDRRQTLMSLTPKCLKLLKGGRAAKQDWLTATLSQKLSVSEQKALLTALQLIKRLVED